MALVAAHKRLSAELVPRSPPVPNVVFVVPVKRAGVKDKRRAGPPVQRRVAVPAVAVYQAWLQRPALLLERQQKPRHDLAQDQFRHGIQRGPLQLVPGQAENVAEMRGEDGAPRVVPEIHGLCDAGVAGPRVESKLSSGGLRLPMHPCQRLG